MGQGGALGGGGQGGSAQGGSAQGGTGGQGGSGGQGGGSNACTWSNTSNPCGAGSYCKAPGCGQGTCVPVTNVDDTTKVPVCGCDGVNYWNVVTASNHGMSVASSAACATPAGCGGIATILCPNVAAHYCGHDVTQLTCNVADAGGICWGMPLTCNIIGFGGQHRLCSNQGGACLYECAAIKLEQNYYSPAPSEMCPQ